MKQQQHAQEIESTRLGGFGGSDAKIFYNFATKGKLTATESKRVAVAKGLIPYVAINQTDAMKKGHEFEDWFETSPVTPIADREVLLEDNLTTKFRTFAHADFASDGGEVWELKCLAKPDEAINTYYAQLQWYYLLGANKVWLVVCDSKQTFEKGTRVPVFVEKDENFIEVLKTGINRLSLMWEEFEYQEREEVEVEDLNDTLQVDIIQFVNLKSQIKALEAEAEKIKENITSAIELEELQVIDGGNFKLSYTKATERKSFDSKKLFKNHPEFNSEEYFKVSKIKPSITLKFTDNEN